MRYAAPREITAQQVRVSKSRCDEDRIESRICCSSDLKEHNVRLAGVNRPCNKFQRHSKMVAADR
jgi:hypothetical protein